MYLQMLPMVQLSFLEPQDLASLEILSLLILKLCWEVLTWWTLSHGAEITLVLWLLETPLTQTLLSLRFEILVNNLPCSYFLLDWYCYGNFDLV